MSAPTFARDLISMGSKTVTWGFRGQWRREEIVHHLVHHGIGSIPIIAISTAFAGLVVTQEIAFHMDHALHTTTMIPGFTGQFIMRELGIAVPALLIVSKVGASMTAEIGGMKVTEQIDALKLLGIDPVGYLVFPRFIAGIIASVSLTLIALAVTLACAILMAVSKFNFSWLEYINNLRHFVGLKDLACALVKALAYGAVTPLIACTYGFRCQGGAQGVGSATTDSVVSATIAVILLDFVLTYLFTLIA
ncbi:ABC transporter permease [bacterium]|nr:ABC transporter permease [bacterium]